MSSPADVVTMMTRSSQYPGVWISLKENVRFKFQADYSPKAFVLDLLVFLYFNTLIDSNVWLLNCRDVLISRKNRMNWIRSNLSVSRKIFHKINLKRRSNSTWWPSTAKNIIIHGFEMQKKFSDEANKKMYEIKPRTLYDHIRAFICAQSSVVNPSLNNAFGVRVGSCATPFCPGVGVIKPLIKWDVAAGLCDLKSYCRCVRPEPRPFPWYNETQMR